MLRWSRHVLDRYVAPGIVEFTAADVPDLRSEFPGWRHWITNHFLNNVLRGAFREPWRQYAVNFIRRAQSTFKFYHDARDLTLSYLDGNEPLNPRVGTYYEAVSAWEAALLNWAICLDIVRRLNQKDVFQKKDGSPEERAYELHNTIKHHALDIHNGSLAGDDVIAVWLTSAGFRSNSHELSYREFADLVRAVARLSSELQDVRTFLTSKGDAPDAPADPA